MSRSAVVALGVAAAVAVSSPAFADRGGWNGGGWHGGGWHGHHHGGWIGPGLAFGLGLGVLGGALLAPPPRVYYPPPQAYYPPPPVYYPPPAYYPRPGYYYQGYRGGRGVAIAAWYRVFVC